MIYELIRRFYPLQNGSIYYTKTYFAVKKALHHDMSKATTTEVLIRNVSGKKSEKLWYPFSTGRFSSFELNFTGTPFLIPEVVVVRHFFVSPFVTVFPGYRGDSVFEDIG